MSGSVNRAIGVFGGTFDPVHVAHLRLAEEARERLSLSEVRWVPSGLPGHRGSPIASAEDRLAMLELAIGDDPHASIDRAELSGEAPTYTVNTLERLRQELGREVPLVLIIGSDQFTALHTWRDWERLFDLAHIAVAKRPGHLIAARRLPEALAAQHAARRADGIGDQPAGRIVVFSMTVLTISSTAIRTAMAAGRSSRHLLPDNVLAYIQSRHLYEAPPFERRKKASEDRRRRT